MINKLKIAASYWKLWLTVVIGIAALILAFGLNQSSYAGWLVILNAAVITIFLSVDMIKTLRSGRYGVDILAITAIIATLAVGQFWASLLIMVMLTGGEALEDFAAHRAKRELSDLLDRAPQLAHVIQADETVLDVPIAEVKPDDIIMVKSHETVPVDGVLVSSRADFDESSLTGESLPAEKKAGDSIMSGSINGSSATIIKATATAANSQFEQIIKLVREAESKPAPFVRMSDRYAVPFTIVSYIIAGTAWYISGDPVRFAEVLVVASPCPLILAAPIAIISGMSRASKHGIIVKSGAVLEKIASATTFTFDKTGTLTHGEVAVSKIVASGISEPELASIAASAETGSSHVLATSLVAYAKKYHLKIVSAKNVREITGDGIFASINGKKILVGKIAFLAKNKIQGLEQKNEMGESSTAIFVAIDGQYAGTIYFSDIVRDDARSTIKQLKLMGVKTIAMLTGDKQQTAARIGALSGVDQVFAELLPADKVKKVRALSAHGGSVVMVGDGVNDAPVLAAADVGIAMGARGSTAASESADAVIMLDRIDRVALLRDISMRTMKIAVQSVWIGILLCLVLMIIAAFGKIPALLGAGLQELIDVTVIFNALRAHKGARA